MPLTTADEVADHLLTLAEERGDEVNNLKLNKLLYYAQAWHLGRYGEPLFPERFQAWSTGPVIPALYWKYKPWSIRHIGRHAAPPVFDDRTARLLREIADEYMWMDEYDLADLTYRETPWIRARGAIDIGDPCETELDEGDMRAFFRHIAEAA
jgi:uncharacterized phage-associated protein